MNHNLPTQKTANEYGSQKKKKNMVLLLINKRSQLRPQTFCCLTRNQKN
uniref:Uncharacterized protein n=1 Tax=Arundo donax TaxID=35708 RepID=A0A0A9FUQ1_ARUDO